VTQTPNSGDERTENGALSLICDALGGTYWERTGQDSTKPDGFIRLSDHSELDVEVFREVIPEFRQASSELGQIKGPIQLDRGSGSWVALLPTDTKFKEFARLSDDVFQNLINDTLARPERSPVREVTISGFPHIILMHLADPEDILNFGVTTASKLNTSFINTHPNSIADFIEREIGDRSAKIQRLVDRASQAGRKAHIAAVIEETTETGMNFSLMGAGSYGHIKLPDSEISLPPGLDAFWVIRGDYEVAVGYVKPTGWTRYEAHRA
jgi:hypothetical protein